MARRIINVLLIALGALAAFYLLVWGIYVVTLPANSAEDHIRLYHADAQQDQWLRSLIRPDTKTSCCSLSDCAPTDAEWRDGQWWAVVRGEWWAIPPEKVLTNPISMDGEAWVCAGPSIVYCFVPPLTSY